MQESQRNPDPDTPEDPKRIERLLKMFVADIKNEDLNFTQLNAEATKGEIGFLLREVGLVLSGFLTLGVHDVQLVRYRGTLYGEHSFEEINRMSKERSRKIVNDDREKNKAPQMYRVEEPNENTYPANRAQRRAAQRKRNKK